MGKALLAREYISILIKKSYQDSKSWDISSLKSQLSENVSIAFLNAHAVNTAYNNQDFAKFLSKTTFLLRDGIGAKIAFKLWGYSATENLNGTDLIPKILAQLNGAKIAIFGASLESITACKNKLEKNGITNVVVLEHGFCSIDRYIELSEAFNPDIIILCMGMPKQEIVASSLMNRLERKLVICGGGWADFYSDTKKRAPLWVSDLLPIN